MAVATVRFDATMKKWQNLTKKPRQVNENGGKNVLHASPTLPSLRSVLIHLAVPPIPLSSNETRESDMISTTLTKIITAGALAATMVGCVAVDDPYYQGGYQGGYGGGYSTTTYTSYPAWQGPGYYYDGGYYQTNPGVSGAIFISNQNDWRYRDDERRRDWERRRDQDRREADRRREQERRDADRRRDQDRREADRRREQDQRDADRRRMEEQRRAAESRRDWGNNNRPLPGGGYQQNQNPEAQRDFNRSERILRQQEQRQLRDPNPQVNRDRAEIFERQRQQREAEHRKNQNPWGTGNSQGN